MHSVISLETEKVTSKKILKQFQYLTKVTEVATGSRENDAAGKSQLSLEVNL